MIPPHSSPPSSSAPIERISGPVEVVQAVPYLLGFHPASSLVLVGLADGTLVVTARVDLPGDLAVDDRNAFASATEHTIAAMHRGGTRQLIAVVYPAAGIELTGVVEVVHRTAVSLPCEVIDVLCVDDGRWRSLGCTDLDCCPPQGRSLPTGPSVFAAAATVSGVVALPDRACVGRQLDPVSGRDALAPLIDAAEDAAHDAVLSGRRRQQLRALRREILTAARAFDERAAGRPGLSIDDETVARLGVALGDTAVRDAVWAAIDDRRVDGRALLRDLARRLPAPYDAPALFLFGWSTWRRGDGALAGMAAERAVASDPTYSAADLLLAALTHGVNPHAVPRMRRPA